MKIEISDDLVKEMLEKFGVVMPKTEAAEDKLDEFCGKVIEELYGRIADIRGQFDSVIAEFQDKILELEDEFCEKVVEELYDKVDEIGVRFERVIAEFQSEILGIEDMLFRR